MSSDCANRIDQWQEFGFEERFETARREIELAESIGYNSFRLILEFEVWDQQHDGFMKRLDRYLAYMYDHGITAMLVLANDCSVPKSLWKPAVMGPQSYDLGYHGGKKASPHQGYGGSDERWSILDDPDIAKRYYTFVREIITTYAHDPRVIIWNLMNEPGNGRGDRSLVHLEKFFEIAWTVSPDQPLMSDVFSSDMSGGRASTNIEQRALELSDVISFHQYGGFDTMVGEIDQLRTLGRPALCTEWLCRILNSNVENIYPLFYLEKIGCYNWGFVAGKYQTYEPWNGVWQEIEAGGGQQYDVTKWQHDLFRPSLRPYDPKEIGIIKRYNEKADARFQSGREHRLFGPVAE
ncbi:MAG: cellulase family glycosylhydrolase [Eubacteriales bacterium]